MKIALFLMRIFLVLPILRFVTSAVNRFIPFRQAVTYHKNFRNDKNYMSLVLYNDREPLKELVGPLKELGRLQRQLREPA